MVCRLSAGYPTACLFIRMMAKRGGKSCAAGGPGQISCTNNSYSPGVSMHIFPRNPKVRTQWLKFVRVHRPDFVDTAYSALCSVHFEESCFTRLKLSVLQVDNDDESETGETSAGNKPREKRVLITRLVPSIQTANKAPAEAEPSDRDRRRSKALSKQTSRCLQLYSLHHYFLTFYCFLLRKGKREKSELFIIIIIIEIIGKLGF